MSFIRRETSYSSLNDLPMSMDQLRASAPSVFASDKHASRSQKYTYIPTIAVVEGLISHGFMPMAAKQGRSRVEGKAEFTKHLIRFRQPDVDKIQAREIGGLYPEVVLVNSHDGTSKYWLMAGLFRLICKNGMMVSDRELASVHVPHKGDVTQQVIDGSYTVLHESRRAIDTAQRWSDIQLNDGQQQAYARAVHTLRFADSDGEVTTAIRPEQMIQTRRPQDVGNDVWRTMNRAQENAIRGGLTALGRDANNRLRQFSSREVKNVDGDVRLNRAIWQLTEELAGLVAPPVALAA